MGGIVCFDISSASKKAFKSRLLASRSAGSNIVVSMQFSLCSVFNLNNKNVSANIVRELLGFTCNRSLTMNSKFSILHEALPSAVLKFLVHC